MLPAVFFVHVDNILDTTFVAISYRSMRAHESCWQRKLQRAWRLFLVNRFHFVLLQISRRSAGWRGCEVWTS